MVKVLFSIIRLPDALGTKVSKVTTNDSVVTKLTFVVTPQALSKPSTLGLLKKRGNLFSPLVVEFLFCYVHFNYYKIVYEKVENTF